jgi:hypothetical protein
MSKLIQDEKGFWKFPDTTADLRWVDKAIPVEEILKTTATPFIACMKSDPELAAKILDNKIKYYEGLV